MGEVNLLANYPKTQRDIEARKGHKAPEVIRVARQFGWDYFDGDRRFGYGGYSYHPRFWNLVVADFQRCYQLTAASSILDVGCGKGFMLYDFARLIPGIKVQGIDISAYAIDQALEAVKPFLKVGHARRLNFPDHSFDAVISINTIHNLDRAECLQSLREIQRVSRRYAFVTVDAYRTEEERQRLEDWNLTARTVLSTREWVALFKEADYQGDYYWFIP